MTRDIEELVLQGAQAYEIEDHAKKNGMITLAESGLMHAINGKTSIEEVYKIISL